MAKWYLCEEKQPNNFDSILLFLKDMRKGLEQNYYFSSATYEDGKFINEFYKGDDFAVRPYSWTLWPQPHKQT